MLQPLKVAPLSYSPLPFRLPPPPLWSQALPRRFPEPLHVSRGLQNLTGYEARRPALMEGCLFLRQLLRTADVRLGLCISLD